mmetsp:Transcript_51334/g.128827  ORF Transcript_51334/g.128827 Transcript_51334/m.128827 type:complete len:113 (-) Transcript_51334:56-394(-)
MEDEPVNRYFQLPEDPGELSCWRYFSVYVDCRLPKRQLEHYYRTGQFGSCDLQQHNFNECISLRLKRYEISKARLDQLTERRASLKAEQEARHVWIRRTGPPPPPWGPSERD